MPAAPIHPATKKLATQLAAVFAQVGADCIPAIQKYMLESDDPGEVSFGARVRFWIDKEQKLRAQLIPKSPKLPTIELDNTDFTLAWSDDHQLALEFVGEAPTSKAEPVAAPPAPTSKAAKSGNGAAAPESPAPPPLPPLPPLLGQCPTLEATGDHDWQPIPDEPGSFFCPCGLRGHSKQPEVTAE